MPASPSGGHPSWCRKPRRGLSTFSCRARARSTHCRRHLAGTHHLADRRACLPPRTLPTLADQPHSG
eukprot:1871831-Lingulodinium_polyedra.AAC.1